MGNAQPGAQGTVCAGGRYDGLVEQLGGRATPAVGFAMGLERLVLLVQAVNADFQVPATVDAYVISSGEGRKVLRCYLLRAYVMPYQR